MHPPCDRVQPWENMKKKTLLDALKVLSTTFLLVCFVRLKNIPLERRTKGFYFASKSSFRSGDNQILTFQMFKYYDVIKCLSTKHETHFTE